MGSWWKDVFAPKKAEKERYNNELKQERKIYPVIEFDYNRWKSLHPSRKIAECNELDKKIDELNIKLGKKIDDALKSDGHRADERRKKVYKTIVDEYKKVKLSRYCDEILLTATQNKTKLKLKEDADATQRRVENDLMKQRTLIMGVGGAVLLLGTFFIIRKV